MGISEGHSRTSRSLLAQNRKRKRYMRQALRGMWLIWLTICFVGRHRWAYVNAKIISVVRPSYLRRYRWKQMQKIESTAKKLRAGMEGEDAKRQFEERVWDPLEREMFTIGTSMEDDHD